MAIKAKPEKERPQRIIKPVKDTPERGEQAIIKILPKKDWEHLKRKP